ncbi:MULTISPECIES: hypothetical protein [Nocardiopsis]|uniref:hypothetical protein n=1 Tax=Nocardiopsis TaxID=2013 RepID=UPI000347DD30|nr:MULTISPECIES: hypothetical protein [Nocardiopsis]PWV45957.1 hypothetical protein BDW27_11511 [Nocardiopsis sp. L17-MgMaSL7]
MIDFVLQPTQEGELRRRVLFWLPAPIPVLGLVYLLVGGAMSAAGWTILLAASVGVGTLLLAVIVQPTPLPEGLAPPVSARRSLHRFRQFTQLRVALALVPVVIGAAAAIAGGGMYPLFAALALAWPQLLLAMPTFFTITRARRAMEAWGTTAYLWHALSRPAKVTWPVLTPLARSYRAWRTDRARRLARQKQEDQQQDQAWKEAVDEEKRNPTEAAAPVGEEPGTEGPRLQRTRKLHALPEELDDQDNEPTTLLPKPELVETEDTPSTGSGTRGTVNRAARQLLEEGGALGLSVRNRRRGHANRRPPSHKP